MVELFVGLVVAGLGVAVRGNRISIGDTLIILSLMALAAVIGRARNEIIDAIDRGVVRLKPPKE